MDRVKKVFCKLMVAALCITLMPVPETEAKAASIKVTKSLDVSSISSGRKISVKGPRIKKITYKSSNKKIATVTKKGKVKAQGRGGKCKITVTVKYKKKKKDKKLTKKKFICRIRVYYVPPCGGTGDSIPLDYYRNKDDVRILNNIIQQQRERGANISSDFSDTSQYYWGYVTNSNGEKELRLGRITWESANLKGEISFQGLDELCALYCYDNQLTKVDLGENTNLEYLDVSSNDLTSLDVSKNTILKYLECEYNQLTELDVNSNTMLERLSCRRNQLSSLDVSKNVALEQLYCSNNELTNLDVSQNTLLKRLECRRNSLTELNVSNNLLLTNLHCGYNQIKNLDVSRNTELAELTCDKDVVVTGYKGLQGVTPLRCSRDKDIVVTGYKEG